MNKNDFLYLIYKNKKNQMKICKKCNNEKELSLFSKDKANKDGYTTYCKECLKLKSKKYQDENKEKVKDRRKEFYNENKDIILEKAKKYHIRNKDIRNKKNREYTENNKEKIKESRKEYYLSNRDEILEKAKLKYKEEDISDEKREEKNERNRLRYSKNKTEINKKRKETHHERIKYDIVYRLSINVKTSIRESLKSSGYRKCKKSEEILGITINEFKIYLESKFESWMTWENRGLYNGELNYGWDIDHKIPLASAKTEYELLKLCHYTNLQPLCSKVNRDIKRDRLDF